MSKAKLPQLSSLAARLDYEFDLELLDLALTHRSYAFEHGGQPDNERLEFLGDTILGKAVTVMLYSTFPELQEGELAKRRARLVSTVALAKIARKIGLGSYLKLGRGEELSGGRDKDSLLADALEAIFGAAFLSKGDDASSELVLRLVQQLMQAEDRFGDELDPKTSLQEYAAKHSLPLPKYLVTGAGPDHDRVFTAKVFLSDTEYGQGEGTSKKQAELAAALQAWQKLKSDA